MKSLLKMTWMEAKLFLREPVGAFFTLVFPLLMLLIFGTIYASQPATASGEPGSISSLIPAFTAMIIGQTGLMSVTITMATYRENGILRRLRTTPVSPLVVMVAQVIVVFTMTSLGMLLLLIAGKLLYNVSFAGNLFNILGGFILGSLSFFGLGFILAGIMPTARTAQVVALVLLYPMLILSGAAWPRELMPDTIQSLSACLPLTYVVNLLHGLWLGEPWSNHLLDVAVLVGMLLLGVIVSAKTFRWE
ncbi:MAG TPA: ABC transporter permease [Phototrophicaceae bacterium]|nr:ABC transporter permease [Phototrophicaceae bacterium]